MMQRKELVKRFFITILIVSWGLSHGQNITPKSKKIKVAKYSSVNVRAQNSTLPPRLYHISDIESDHDSYRLGLQSLKKEMKDRYPHRSKASSYKYSQDVEQPTIGKNFEGNIWEALMGGGGVPNDNTMAISNDGILISAVNRSIYFFDITQSDSTPVSMISLDVFTDTLNAITTQTRYDPKLRYDPEQDRFVLICLAGSNSSDTYIIAAFSLTSDPLGDWGIYAIPGNPKQDTSWSDFPAIALTQDELFITINLLEDRSTGAPDEWKFLFKESIIWQVDKHSGYNGADSLTLVYHDSILFNNAPIRNLTPAQGGSGLQGPNIYFLSNRNFDLENDTIFILEITNTIDNLNTELNIGFSLADIPYGLPPNARQALGHYFDVNDSRVLGCFIENDKIQYVQNSRDMETGFPGIYHGIITDLEGNRDIKGYMISDPDTLVDFGFPNIAYTGTNTLEDHALIGFNYSGPADDTTGYAGIAAVFYINDSENSGYADKVIIKSGDTISNMVTSSPLGPEYERWGDYFGIQRKYDDTGTVWLSGFYGRLFQPSAFYKTPRNGTWISEVNTPTTKDEALPSKQEITVYPNPTNDRIYSLVKLPEEGDLQVNLYYKNGLLVDQLIDQNASAGEKEFSFSTAEYSSGVYILKYLLDGKEVLTEKVVIAK